MNKMLKEILDYIDVGIHVINEIGRTVIYNKKMTEIESMDIDDVLDKNVLDVFRFADEENSTLVQALKKGKITKNVKQTYLNNKGQEITTINNTFPIFEKQKIIGAVEIAKDVTKLENFIKNNILKKGDTKYTFDSIVGVSPAINRVIEQAKLATRTSSSVLIIGETGTGKELFAQSIHNGSNRSSAPLISQNCAALPENLIESLLFGTKKGAFTGAVERPGLFEQAEGGTLLLDEINSLSENLQAKLLRTLQEKTIRRIGDTKERKVDVRIMATINEDPIDAVSQKRLRKDLYYRLSVVSLFIPPLRERKEDIPLLVQNFIDKYNSLFEMNVRDVDKELEQIFLNYHWPGNVRELEHIIEGAMNLMAGEDIISYFYLPAHFRNKMQSKEDIVKHKHLLQNDKQVIKTLKEQMDELEEYYIKKALRNNNNNISRTAKILGISRQSLQYRLKKHGMKM